MPKCGIKTQTVHTEQRNWTELNLTDQWVSLVQFSYVAMYRL